MNPVATAIVTGAIVVGGKWADGHAPNVDNAVGVAGIAVALALIRQGNTRLSDAFSWLILMGVGFVYIPKIVYGTGLASPAKAPSTTGTAKRVS
jgi:hypothetical protein